MKLGQYFSLEEFEASETAERMGIDNRVPAVLMPNLRKLISTMDQVRALLGVPVHVTSGYRTKKLNSAVHGAQGSDHVLAAAVDFIAPEYGSPFEICTALHRHVDRFGIKQLIQEYGRWVHIGVIPVAEINRVLTIDHAGVRTGIHPTYKA